VSDVSYATSHLTQLQLSLPQSAGEMEQDS